MITVTLQQIKNANLGISGWEKVLKANGGVHADLNKPFPLVSILDSNGLDDTLCVIENVPELSAYDIIWRKFVKWCALQNITKIKPYCSDNDYKLIVEYLKSESEELRAAAQGAAESAAWSAESAAWSAESAAWSARSAESAARSAAWSARSARSAAWSARSAVWSAESAESVRLSAWTSRLSAELSAELAAGSAAESAAVSQETKLRELLS